MVSNILYNSKTAKIDRFEIFPLAAPEKIYEYIEVSMHCFYCFIIPIHNENQYKERRE